MGVVEKDVIKLKYNLIKWGEHISTQMGGYYKECIKLVKKMKREN